MKKVGLFMSVVKILMGRLVKGISVCVVMLVKLMSMVFVIVEVGSKILFFGFMIVCSRCGMIRLMNLISLVKVIVLVVRIVEVVMVIMCSCLMLMLVCFVVCLFSVSILSWWLRYSVMVILMRVMGRIIYMCFYWELLSEFIC